MGLIPKYLDFILNSCGEIKDKKMLELGNQFIMDSSIPEKTGHEYYSNRGVDHISIDLYDKEATYQFDLTKPFPVTWKGYFDIITNSGTTEHVEPKEGQYQAYKNIHDDLKVSGIVVHILPSIDTYMDTGAWAGHCNYYYNNLFVLMLAAENNYEIIERCYINDLLAFAFRKIEDREFMSDKAKFLRYIDERRIT